jgi:DNA-binding transcriptional MerR regulator
VDVDWSIQEVARLAGTTSRTLRHYDQVGLLPPSRTGTNGYRYYDQAALTRLARILLLRDLGLGIPAIASVLAGERDDAAALQEHLVLLAAQRDQIDRQICAVQTTIASIRNGTPIMADQILEGFDHTGYRQEVEQRWGKEAYARSDAWWRGLGAAGQQAHMAEHLAIAGAWATAQEAGLSSDDPQVAQIARRHVAWITTGWGGRVPTPDAIAGLADMYVADDRFAANYGGTAGAQYVRDGLIAFALAELG